MKKLLSLWILAYLPFSVWANQLDLSKDFNVLKVNGQAYKSSFLGKSHNIKLGLGPQRLELQYEAFYDVGFDDHEKITSAPFVVRFNSTGVELVADYVKPDTRFLAQKYATTPRFKLFTKGEHLEIPVDFLPAENKEHAGILGFFNKKDQARTTESNMENPVIQKKILNQDTAIPEKVSSNSAKVVESEKNLNAENITKTENPPKKENNTLEELRFWWDRASIEDRQIFIREILK